MSFSAEVKEELTEYMPRGRHCQIAELAAIIVFCGRVRMGAVFMTLKRPRHFMLA